jgi:hypothetical protein
MTEFRCEREAYGFKTDLKKGRSKERKTRTNRKINKY